jgi:hypothetical protein
VVLQVKYNIPSFVILGLAAAIRLKQLQAEKNQDISVCLIEKGS